MDKYLSNKIKILSFLSIIMVVYLHAYNLKDRFLQSTTVISDEMNFTSFFQYFISNGLTRIAVPIFFAISGYLFFINLDPKIMGFIRKLWTRVRTLLIPYLFWSVLGLLFLYLTQLVPNLQDCFDRGLVKDYTTTDYIIHILLAPIPFQLWFVFDLIIFVILSPIIYVLLKKLWFFPLIPFFLLWIADTYCPLFIINNEGLFFFMLGAYLGIRKVKAKRNLNSKIIGAIAILWIALLCYKTYKAYTPDVMVYYLSSGVLVIPLATILLHKVCILLGLITVWFGYDILVGEIKENSKILKLTSFTFFIFAAHEPVMNILTNEILKIGPSNYAFDLVVYIFIPALIITLLILLGNLLRKYLKPIYNIITGGRGF